MKETISQIRKDVSERMIFAYCWGKSQLGIKIVMAEFDVDKCQYNLQTLLPGKIRKMEIDINFGGE